MSREQSPVLTHNSNENWTSLGQLKRKPEFPVVTRESRHNSRKTTCDISSNGVSAAIMVREPDVAIATLLKLCGSVVAPTQYSCLENPMDGGAWWAAVHGVMKSWTRLSDFTLTFHFHALEKEMATHSSVLAWRIPGMGEPGGLPSMGLHRVGHD